MCIRDRGGALRAHRLPVLDVGELAAVMHEEAARAGELIRLSRKYPHRELFAREVGTGQLEALGGFGLVFVDNARGLVRPTRLELLERVLAEVLFRLARCVVVSCHLRVLSGSVVRSSRYAWSMHGRPGLFPRGDGDCAPFRAKMQPQPRVSGASRSASSSRSSPRSVSTPSVGPAITSSSPGRSLRSPTTVAPAAVAIRAPAAMSQGLSLSLIHI